MTAAEPLPHVFPFRFAERKVVREAAGEGTVRLGVSASEYWSRGAPLPATLLPEILAQAALLLSGTDVGRAGTGFLAGVSGFEVLGEASPGDVLTVDVRIAARLGAAVRFEGEIRREDGGLVARGALAVREAGPGPS